MKKSKQQFSLSKLLFLIILISAIFIPLNGLSQQTLADADWFERELGSGVVWRFYLFDNMFGSKQSVSYIEVDLDNPNVSVEFPYLASTRQKTSSMIPAQFSNAVAGMNGTYFETISTGGHRTYLRIDNAVIPAGGALFSAWGYEGALAKDSSENLSMPSMPSGGWVNNTVNPDIIACGPLLVINDIIQTSQFTAIGSHCTSRHPRSAAGITDDNRLILVTVDGRTDLATGMTCQELAELMSWFGCDDALNYDGGGSTTLWGKGEPYNGVLNYPSDNSTYDHNGERSCSNAIAVISTAPSVAEYDARITSKSFSGFMDSEAEQTVTLVYTNIGTQTWTAANIKLVLARPDTRTSVFYDSATWVSTSEPAAMTPATVAPGEQATFSFKLKAPAVSSSTICNEHFKLTLTGTGRFGPADSEAWMRIIVDPVGTITDSFIVESRAGGKNYAWYSDSGMADSGTHCLAEGTAGNIGTRYGSTYVSVAGAKSATIAPNFPLTGDYKVYAAWGNGSNRRNPISFNINHTGGSNKFLIDQTAAYDIWVQIGTDPFRFNDGYGGTVVMTNEDINVSGSMYIGAVKFEYVPGASESNWYLY